MRQWCKGARPLLHPISSSGSEHRLPKPKVDGSTPSWDSNAISSVGSERAATDRKAGGSSPPWRANACSSENRAAGSYPVGPGFESRQAFQSTSAGKGDGRPTSGVALQSMMVRVHPGADMRP